MAPWVRLLPALLPRMRGAPDARQTAAPRTLAFARHRPGRRGAIAALLVVASTMGLFGAGFAAHAAAEASEASAQGPASLEALMRNFASGGGVRAGFQEVRTLSILAEPLESWGVLYFAPPDRLARVTTQPGPSRVVVRGTRVFVDDATGPRTIDLGSSEVARGLVENLVVLLRGDLPTLRDRYEVDFVLEDQTWRLDLLPRAEKIRAVIERIRIRGAGNELTEMVTRETNGDSTLATFFDVEIGFDFDAGSHAEVFEFESTGPAR